jgi:hypothetical protein
LLCSKDELPLYADLLLDWKTRCRPTVGDWAWLDAVGAPIGVQQKLIRHAHGSATAIYGGAVLMS